ncbi:MAG: 3-hydroxyacyl-ACP dehydratase FabZ [bacterium]
MNDYQKGERDEIYDAIPHRPPFLFVDKILYIEEEKIKTIKYVKKDEFFFKGHYPGYPIMPGVLICEAIYQTGALLLSKLFKKKGMLPVLTQIKKVKFKRRVVPDEVLEIEVFLLDRINKAYYLKGKASVSGKLVAYTEFVGTMITEAG